MAFKMYKGDTECVADMEQLAVMTNAGWSRIKEVPKAEEPAPVDEPADTPEAPVDEPVADEPEKAAPKKAAPKKRRSAKK